MKKLTNKDLGNVRSRIEEIFNDIDNVLNSIGIEQAESEKGQGLMNAQSSLDDAMSHINDSMD